MKFSKFIIGLFFVFFAFTSTIYAKANTIFLGVPFQNIPLATNATIQASFSFGQFPIIFCYENNQQTVGIITWPFQGNISRSTLPVTLVTNGIFQGQFSDPAGTITITNNQNTTLIVNCVFGF